MDKYFKARTTVSERETETMMNNKEKVRAALAAIRKRWMEAHDGKTPQEYRSAALPTDSADCDINAYGRQKIEAG